MVPAMNVSPTRSVPSCTRIVATGPRPLSSLASSTVPDALRFGFAFSSLSSVTSSTISSSAGMFSRFFAETGDRDGLTAPVFRHQPEIRQLLLDAIGVGVRLVDLVDRDEDWHVRRARVIDRLPRLRHDAVVGRDDQDDHVGDPGAARAHHREGLVARRVEEHDVAVAHLHRVGADVLGDAAGFALGDARLADRVEQRRLAVVDVAHDGDDRAACDQILGARFLGLDLQQLLFERLHLHVRAELARDHGCGLGVERAVDGHHHALVHQLLQDVLRLDVELRREIGNGHALSERDGAGDRRRRGRSAGAAGTRATDSRRGPDDRGPDGRGGGGR